MSAVDLKSLERDLRRVIELANARIEEYGYGGDEFRCGHFKPLIDELRAARRVVETAQDNEAALAAVLDRLRHNGWEGLRVSLVAWQKRLRAALADYDRLSKP